jgi:hypothetical protein
MKETYLPQIVKYANDFKNDTKLLVLYIYKTTEARILKKQINFTILQTMEGGSPLECRHGMHSYDCCSNSSKESIQNQFSNL